MLISLKLSLYSSKDYVFLAFVQTRTSQHVGKFTTWVKIKRISAIKQAALYGHSDPSQEEEAGKNPNDTKKVLDLCDIFKFTILTYIFLIRIVVVIENTLLWSWNLLRCPLDAPNTQT